MDKERVKQEILSWLRNRGWPNVPSPDTFILENLEPIYDHLIMLRLVHPAYRINFIMWAQFAWNRKMGI